MFFDKNGILNLDENIAEQPSFKKIMEDGIVTDQELSEQSDKVLSLLRRVEEEMSIDHQELVKELLIESNVMSAVFHQHQIQNIR